MVLGQVIQVVTLGVWGCVSQIELFTTSVHGCRTQGVLLVSSLELLRSGLVGDDHAGLGILRYLRNDAGVHTLPMTLDLASHDPSEEVHADHVRNSHEEEHGVGQSEDRGHVRGRTDNQQEQEDTVVDALGGGRVPEQEANRTTARVSRELNHGATVLSA